MAGMLKGEIPYMIHQAARITEHIFTTGTIPPFLLLFVASPQAVGQEEDRPIKKAMACLVKQAIA